MPENFNPHSYRTAIEAVDAARIALDDWLNTYASELCDEKRVAEANKRIGECGTLAYIAHVQAGLRDALATLKRLDGPNEGLLHEARNAENKLRHLGNTFSSTNFTDRYGDGPACLDLADRLRKEIKRCDATRSRHPTFIYKCVDCGSKNETPNPPESNMLACKKCGFMTVQTLDKVKR